MKLAWHNCYSLREADIIVFGSASSQGSLYKGTNQAPNEIRTASNKWLSGETLQGKKFVLHPTSGPIKKKVFDAHNIEKDRIPELVERIALKKKIPAMLGGDHSSTLEALKGIAAVHNSFSVVYFDAHLDMVPDQGRFYGSLFNDAFSIKQLKITKSVCVGCRAVREKELKNAKKRRLNRIPAIKVGELGVKKTFKKIKKITSKRVYLSIDMDCLDPSNAPGVSDPVPGGLTSNQLIALSKKIARNGVIGFDVMETNPLRDQFNLTVNLAAKLVSEIMASIR